MASKHEDIKIIEKEDKAKNMEKENVTKNMEKENKAKNTEIENEVTDGKASSSGATDNVQGDKCIEEEEEADSAEEDEPWMEKLQHFFASKLNIGLSDSDVDDSNFVQVLDEVTVEGIVSYIKSGKCKNIITLTGAGISTSAGIPDFRSPESGLYNNLAKYDLPNPEAIFDIGYFKLNPKPFFDLAKELYPGSFNPTPSHHFIKLLHDKGLLLRHYTQNIDTLEHIAGIPAEKIVEAHGTFRTAHCLGCNKPYEQEWMKVEILAGKIPTCTECEGVVKPDIVFFRECLPSRFYTLMSDDFHKCDLLIIMGTSLTVQPFASLIDRVPPHCPRLLINREKVGISFMAAFQCFFGSQGGGLAIDSPKNKRDVGLIGDCDSGCLIFAEKLGWKEELQALINQKKLPQATTKL